MAKKTVAKDKNDQKKKAPTEEPATPPSFETVGVSERVLLQTPTRALRFITGINRSPTARAALEARGYTAAVRKEGWTLLRRVAGEHLLEELPDAATVDKDVAKAQDALNAADEEFFGIIKLTLQHRQPTALTRLLKGVSAVDSASAWQGIEVVLDRLDALEKEAGKTAKEAIELLAVRGIDRKRRDELRALVEVAKGSNLQPTPSAQAQESAAATHSNDRETELRALRELRAWFEEWSGLARIVVKRRDVLVRLGLASKAKKSKAPSTEET